jgi:hypothetical protein
MYIFSICPRAFTYANAGEKMRDVRILSRARGELEILAAPDFREVKGIAYMTQLQACKHLGTLYKRFRTIIAQAQIPANRLQSIAILG